MNQVIEVVVGEQCLRLLEDEVEVVRFPVSTAANGCGELFGSFKTPRGKHVIRAKIGDGFPVGSVFVGRRPTGEVYSAELGAQFPDRDWILSRILWLSGCEVGVNRLGDVDSMRRFIYIHGTHEEDRVGEACSHGCVRMRNRDVVDLFDRVEVGAEVNIVE